MLYQLSYTRLVAPGTAPNAHTNSETEPRLELQSGVPFGTLRWFRAT